MTSVTNLTFKPLSASDTCLLSFPSSIFALKPSHRCLSISTKPVKLHLSTKPVKLHLSTLPSLPLAPRPKTHFPSPTTHVAQTSDWAQQDPAAAEEEEEGGPTWGSEEKEDEEGGYAEPPEEEEGGPTWGSEEKEDEEGGYAEPPEEAKIFVGNLPYDLDSQTLAQLFEKSGTVEIAEVIYNRATDMSRGFGFVTMSTVEEADKAVELMNQYEINGRALTVNKAAPRGTRAERPVRADESSYNIYVGNIPWDVDNVRLEQVFSEHGKVVSAKVIYDRETGRSRGFGFVSMASETEMNDAIAALDGQDLDGRSIRVNAAETRPSRGF